MKDRSLNLVLIVLLAILAALALKIWSNHHHRSPDQQILLRKAH